MKTLNFGGEDTYLPAPDWKNVDGKPFTEVGGDTLTWDGNTEGLEAIGAEVIGIGYYKVSNAEVTIDDETTGVTGVYNNTIHECIFQTQNGVTIIAPNDGSPLAFCVQQNGVGVDLGGFSFPEVGVYFAFISAENDFYAQSLTIPGYTGFTKETLNTDALPEHTHSWESLTDKPFESTIEEIMPETEVAGVENNGGYSASLDASLFTGDEETLYVKFDGVEYTCNRLDTGHGYPVYGNALYDGGTDTGEPFCILVALDYGMAVIVFTDANQHTVGISKSAAKKLDPAYYDACTTFYVDLAGENLIPYDPYLYVDASRTTKATKSDLLAVKTKGAIVVRCTVVGSYLGDFNPVIIAASTLSTYGMVYILFLDNDVNVIRLYTAEYTPTT